MAWLSSVTAIYLHSCVLFTAAFYLLRGSYEFLNSPLVIVLGQAMLMNRGTISADKGGGQVMGIISLLLAAIGLTDVSQLVERNHVYFESVIPTRLLVSFALAGYGYLFETSFLHDDLVFTLLCVEIWFHFVIYNVVREEKHDRNRKYEEKLEAELLEIQQDDEKFTEIIAKVERTRDI